MNHYGTTSALELPRPAPAGPPPHHAAGMRVAYLMSRFPKITETFVLREMIELERQGFVVEVFPLRREKSALVQPDAQPYVERAYFTPLASCSMLWANLSALCRQPGVYLGTLATLIRANLGCLRFLSGALLFFPKAVYFARQMKRKNISHLHAHFASHPAAVAFTVQRFSGIPYSFVAHGSDLHRDQHMLVEKVREAKFVAAISQYNRQMILDICGQEYADRVHVLHCGIDSTRFAPRAGDTPYDRGEGPLRLLCIGTLHEVKGQTHLIEACRILADRGREVSCHFLGAGADLPQLQRQVEQAKLGGSITFHGACTSDQVLDHLQLADVLVAPSVPSSDGRREGIPVVLMEAMACGVPCVASRLSGIPELVEHQVTGLLAPPGNAAAIAEALELLATNSTLRKEMGSRSVEKVQREFDLSKTTAGLAKLLEHSAGGSEQ